MKPKKTQQTKEEHREQKNLEDQMQKLYISKDKNSAEVLLRSATSKHIFEKKTCISLWTWEEHRIDKHMRGT